MFIKKIKLINKRGFNIFVNVKSGTDDVIIVCHGFDSSKSGSTIKYLQDNLDYTIVSFDFPSHGESDEELLLENCLDDLSIVDNYVRNNFHGHISLFGSSFGAFVILNYLKNNNYFYKSIVLKSVAIKMDKVFSDVLLDENIDIFKSRGYTIKDRNKKMIIPYRFYEELVDNKIDASNIVKDKDIFIFHGVNDDTALIDDLNEFALSNIHIIKLDGVTHTFKKSDMDFIVNKMYNNM